MPIYSAQFAKLFGYIVQGFMILFLIIFLILGILKVAPLQVFWNVVNQYQLILLLPLLGTYIPKHVEDSLLISSFLWNPFGFVDIANWFGIKEPSD